jgi:PBP1b-binding outer membrane lipoprotein LpoB
MKKNALLSLAAGALTALLAGCASQAQHVDSGSGRTLLNVGKINMQDWNMAAEAMINSLVVDVVDKGKLESADGPGKPSILAISRIVNSTSQQIDTDLLIKQIRVQLNKTGKVLTSTTMGLGGPEDPLAAETQKEQKIGRRPDYTLSGKIIEDRSQVGNVRESTYSFQLSLTRPDGLAIWEDLKNITKQGKKSSATF